MTFQAVFLSVEQVLAIHREMVATFVGDPGVRDHGLLRSAVAMPTATFEGNYLHKSIPEMAAAYLFHICRNHPFVDGNKRTALVAANVFLVVNGCRLDATDNEIEDLTMGVAAGRYSKDTVTGFFSRHTRSE